MIYIYNFGIRFNEQQIKEVSDAMKAKLPRYEYINLDSGWYLNIEKPTKTKILIYFTGVLNAMNMVDGQLGTTCFRTDSAHYQTT